jgi:hypothetical protein
MFLRDLYAVSFIQVANCLNKIQEACGVPLLVAFCYYVHYYQQPRSPGIKQMLVVKAALIGAAAGELARAVLFKANVQ